MLPVIQTAAEDASEVGKSTIQEIIDTSGTQGPWPDQLPSHYRHSGNKLQPDGTRNDTGKMRDSVDARVYVSKRNTVSAEVGWRPGSPKYFRAQEYGFEHNLTGNDIAGMFALREGKEAMFEVIADRIEQDVREYFKK